MSNVTSESVGRTECRRTLALLGLCVALTALASPIRPGIVLGESMAPMFRSGQVFLVCRQRGGAWVPDRGDVVLFDLNGQTYIKRVYALPGDGVWGVIAPGEEGQLSWVVPPSDLAWTQDLLLRYPALGELVSIRVPPEAVYVLGDADDNSYDSRAFGPLPVAAIGGRVVVSRLFGLWSPDPSGRSVTIARENRDSGSE